MSMIKSIYVSLFIMLVLLGYLLTAGIARSEDYSEDYEYLSRVAVQIRIGDTSGGSGVVIAPHYVLTNAHVVRGTEHAKVVINEGEEVHGIVIHRDVNLDIAVLHTPYYEGEVAVVGMSMNMKIGNEILAVTSPYFLHDTFSFGHIVGINRDVSVRPHKGVMQIAANIGPGSSGGPVFNRQLEVIGLVFAGNRGDTQVGFVIPIDMVKHKVFDAIDMHEAAIEGWR